MIVVWKFKLIQKPAPMEQQAIEMPAEAEILRVGVDQYLNACIWARVDTDKPDEYRRFMIYPTGVEIEYPDHGRYVGSIQKETQVGWFLYHVFELA